MPLLFLWACSGASFTFTFTTQCIYMFPLTLTVQCDYLPAQSQLPVTQEFHMVDMFEKTNEVRDSFTLTVLSHSRLIQAALITAIE